MAPLTTTTTATNTATTVTNILPVKSRLDSPAVPGTAYFETGACFGAATAGDAGSLRAVRSVEDSGSGGWRRGGFYSSATSELGLDPVGDTGTTRAWVLHLAEGTEVLVGTLEVVLTCLRTAGPHSTAPFLRYWVLAAVSSQ